MTAMIEMIVLFFVGFGCGVGYTYLIVKTIAKKRGVWEILNEKKVK